MPRKTAHSRNFFHNLGLRSAKNAGFTLVELMIVIVIVGVVAMAAFPAYDQVQTRMEYDNVYSDLRTAVHRCRAEALSSPYPSTAPTTLTIFPNGYSCVAWWDTNGDFALGVKNTAMIGDLTVNGLGGEVRHVFFQRRFFEDLELSDQSGEVFVNFSKSRVPAGGSVAGGYSFLITPGGYLLAPNRNAILDNYIGGPAGLALAKRDASGNVMQEYSVIKIYPSGQIE